LGKIKIRRPSMSEEINFGDRNTTDEFGVDIARYKAANNMKDIICIISNPIKFYQHRFDFPPSIANCGKSKGKCLFCERGYDRGIRIACIVVHLAEKKDNPDAKYKEVGELKVWIFGKDKWTTLNGILDDYPQIRQDGFKKHDLIVSCKDETFQKLEIRPTLKPSMITKEMLARYKDAKKQLEWFITPCSLERQKELLDDKGDISGEVIGEDEKDGAELNEAKGSMLVDKHSENSINPKASEDIDSLLSGLDNDKVPF
jgi:hypothetical protein